MQFELQLPEQPPHDMAEKINENLIYWQQEIPAFEQYKDFITYAVINFHLKDTTQFHFSVKVADKHFENIEDNFVELIYAVPHWLTAITNHDNFHWLASTNTNAWQFNFMYVQDKYLLEVHNDYCQERLIAQEMIDMSQLDKQLTALKKQFDDYIMLQLFR